MRGFLTVAAALLALAVPASPAEADRGGSHWRSGHHGQMWRDHRGFRRDFRRHHRDRGWRDHRRFRDDWRWRRHRGIDPWHFRHDPWRFRHHRDFDRWRFRHRRPFGWGHGCRTIWFDGWSWRCGW